MQSWLPELVAALGDEIEHIRRNASPSRTQLHGGASLRSALSTGAGVSPIQYRTSDVDAVLASDTIGTLRLPTQTLNASVLQSEPGLLVLAVEHPSGPLTEFESGVFERDNTDLTRRLRDVLAMADEHNFNWDLLEKVQGIRSPIVHRLPVDADELSEDQLDAVSLAAGSEVVFLQGPPGTGKTHTIGRIVRSVLDSRRSILVASHTHVAVDQALLATIDALGDIDERRLLRLGSARLPEVPNGVIRTDAGAALAALGSSPSAVFCTLAKRYVDPSVLAHKFDVVLIDEVSMVNAALAIPALGGAKRGAILVGDPHQLPPIVQSDSRVARRWLGRDLFELCNATSQPYFTKLVHQRRMRPPIADIARTLRYSAEELKDHPSTHRDAPNLEATPLGDTTLVALEATVPRGAVQWFEHSAWNLHSALASVTIAKSLLEQGDFVDDGRRAVGIITFYTKQRMLLTRLCAAAGILDRVLPGTVHTFQGNEVQVAILDPVLTSQDQNNRLRDAAKADETTREMNVAISRARDQLIVVGDVAGLRVLPRASGLGKLMACFGPLPLTSWDMAKQQDMWPTHASLADLLRDLSDLSTVIVIDTKRSVDQATVAITEAVDAGHRFAILCADNRPRPLSLPRSVNWIRLEDPAPPMVVTQNSISIADEKGTWITVTDRATHKLVSDFLHTTALLDIVQSGKHLSCKKCGSDLTREQRRYGRLKGEFLLICTGYGVRGCEGTLIRIGNTPRRDADSQFPTEIPATKETPEEKARRLRIAKAKERAADSPAPYFRRSSVALCSHRMRASTCFYCK